MELLGFDSQGVALGWKTAALQAAGGRPERVRTSGGGRASGASWIFRRLVGDPRGSERQAGNRRGLDLKTAGPWPVRVRTSRDWRGRSKRMTDHKWIIVN